MMSNVRNSHVLQLPLGVLSYLNRSYGSTDTGMILLKANDEKEARNLVTNDRAIEHKIFKAEVFSFYPFYGGCVE